MFPQEAEVTRVLFRNCVHENVFCSTGIFPCPMLIESHSGLCFIFNGEKLESHPQGSRVIWWEWGIAILCFRGPIDQPALLGRERCSTSRSLLDISRSDLRVAHPSASTVCFPRDDHLKRKPRRQGAPAGTRAAGVPPGAHWSGSPFKVSEFFMLVVEI